MAFWQYSFHAMPKNNIKQKYQTLPTKITDDDFNNLSWFNEFNYQNFIQSIDYLSPNTHWCKSTIFFGTYDSDSIEIGFDDSLVSYIYMRIDLRENHLLILDKMLSSLALNQLMIIDNEMVILEPLYEDIMKKIEIDIRHKNNFFKTTN
ncbi:hypothetical protein [Thorsellia anophelis]|uniref:Uncharacterized protein n=1 Tax=Thorsellia anophelis DSM 18579 TaxID=1123402 RepID=A0A1I0DQB7_9GAMM|nr:hypothetical protein [Thorsellia anophelis]SET34747.1 hypothetical protein SAMN02583745_02088 [Thorsellia anophelis DSM 18579]